MIPLMKSSKCIFNLVRCANRRRKGSPNVKLHCFYGWWWGYAFCRWESTCYRSVGGRGISLWSVAAAKGVWFSKTFIKIEFAISLSRTWCVGPIRPRDSFANALWMFRSWTNDIVFALISNKRYALKCTCSCCGKIKREKSWNLTNKISYINSSTYLYWQSVTRKTYVRGNRYY